MMRLLMKQRNFQMCHQMKLVSQSCSNYHSVEDFNLLNIQKINIFHTNINGLESKIDILHEFMSGTSNKLNIVALIETSEKEDIEFTGNVEIDGYQKFHKPLSHQKEELLFMLTNTLTRLRELTLI